MSFELFLLKDVALVYTGSFIVFWLCRIKYNWISSANAILLLISWLPLVITWILLTSNISMPLKIRMEIISGIEIIVFYLHSYRWKVFLLACGSFTLRIVYLRWFKPRFYKWYQRYYKRELNPRDQRQIDLRFRPYSAWEYLKEGTFFVGIDDQNRNWFDAKYNRHKHALYLTKKRLTQHVQVIGGTGKGKTESILKPFSIQNIINGNATVFIDGKADTALIKQIPVICKQYNKTYYLFNTLDIQKHENSELCSLSHSFNPLLFSKHASKLTDILSTALGLQSDTDANYYFETQKSFLMILFNLFLATERAFTFEDIVEFMSYDYVRDYVYVLAVNNKQKNAVSDMKSFLFKLSKTHSELLGLRILLEQLFVSDSHISKLVNVYHSEIDIEKSLNNRDFILFSLSAGDRYRSNMALAKMVISILNSLVGSKQGFFHKEFWMLIFDEFGQYATDTLSPLITTARNTNTSVILSHQSQSQLGDTLNEIVKDNTDTKFLFQTQSDADDWAKHMGTIETYKRTDVFEDDVLGTEEKTGMSSNREVDAFFIDPNVYRNLNIGQSVCKYSPDSHDKGLDSKILSHGIYEVKSDEFPTININDIDKSTSKIGLNLREKRIQGVISKKKIKKVSSKKTNKDSSVEEDVMPW